MSNSEFAGVMAIVFCIGTLMYIIGYTQGRASMARKFTEDLQMFRKLRDECKSGHVESLNKIQEGLKNLL